MLQTIQTRLRLSDAEERKLDVLLDGYSRATRLAFVLIYRKKISCPLAGTMLREKFGLTARQWDSIVIELRRQHKCWREQIVAEMTEVGRKLAFHETNLHNSLMALSDWRVRHAQAMQKRGQESQKIQAIKSYVFEHRRNIQRYQARLRKLKNELASDVPRICFGTAARARCREHVGRKGATFATIDEWKAAWQEARSSSMRLVGSKRESFGNLSIQYDPVAETVSISLLKNQAEEQLDQLKSTFARVPTRVPGRRDAKRLIVNGVTFPGRKVGLLMRAFAGKKAVTMTLLRRRTRKGDMAYYLCATFAIDAPATPVRTSAKGTIGIGFDGRRCSIAWIGKAGNLMTDATNHGNSNVPKHRSHAPVKRTNAGMLSAHPFCLVSGSDRMVGDFEWKLASCDAGQRLHAVRLSACRIVSQAKRHGLDVSIGMISFETFKRLRAESARSTWMDSQTYGAFHKALQRSAEREGVLLNYSGQENARLIGYCKYAGPNNLTNQAAEGMVVARQVIFENLVKKGDVDRSEYVERLVLSRPMPARVRSIPSRPRGNVWEHLAQVIGPDERCWGRESSSRPKSG